MSAEQIYRLLPRAYPPDFRAEYGREMVLLFRDQCREHDAGRDQSSDQPLGHPRAFARQLRALIRHERRRLRGRQAHR